MWCKEKKMDKIKRIINYVSWGIIGITGLIFVVNWENIPASVITHIGFGSVSYGSKYTLIIIFVIEIIVPIYQGDKKNQTAILFG